MLRSGSIEKKMIFPLSTYNELTSDASDFVTEVLPMIAVALIILAAIHALFPIVIRKRYQKFGLKSTQTIEANFTFVVAATNATVLLLILGAIWTSYLIEAGNWSVMAGSIIVIMFLGLVLFLLWSFDTLRAFYNCAF